MEVGRPILPRAIKRSSPPSASPVEVVSPNADVIIRSFVMAAVNRSAVVMLRSAVLLEALVPANPNAAVIRVALATVIRVALEAVAEAAAEVSGTPYRQNNVNMSLTRCRSRTRSVVSILLPEVLVANRSSPRWLAISPTVFTDASRVAVARLEALLE